MATAEPAIAGRRVLLVDDDSSVLRNFRWCLEDENYQVSSANGAEQALRLAERQVFDLCFLDLLIGEDSGLDLLPRLLAVAPEMRVVMATGESAVNTAVRAIQLGARDYLVKPISPDQLLLAAQRHAEARRLELRVASLETQARESGDADAAGDLDSASKSMASLLATTLQVADTDATVLILGESGTGKGVLARAIHQWSRRRQGSFATINAPSLSAELLESELFGHVKGAFTGAVENRQGRVQIADGGTLFLDEIGDIALSLQPKLLRLVQDREYERVGDPHTRSADVRIVAATNRPLEQMVREGSFREDLWYRLNVINLELPPLRERAEDIEGLAQRFLLQFALAYRRPARQFSAASIEALRSHRWPGNIRELRNTVERIAILCPTETADLDQLPPVLRGQAPGAPRIGTELTLADLERMHIEAVLATRPTLDAAAKTLGIDSSTLYRKRKQYEL
jgi:NtrC-family two-component system response regulator AlgB